MWRERKHRALLVGMQTGAAVVEESMNVLRKVKNRITLWPSNHTPRYLPKECKDTNSKGCVHPYVYCSIICNRHIMEVTQASMDEWIKKTWYIYNGILFSRKKNEIPPFAMTCMDLEGFMLSQISQSEKDKYRMVPRICGIQETKQMKEEKKRQANAQTLSSLQRRNCRLPEGRWVGDGWSRWRGLRAHFSWQAPSSLCKCWITALSTWK